PRRPIGRAVTPVASGTSASASPPPSCWVSPATNHPPTTTTTTTPPKSRTRTGDGDGDGGGGDDRTDRPTRRPTPKQTPPRPPGPARPGGTSTDGVGADRAVSGGPNTATGEAGGGKPSNTVTAPDAVASGSDTTANEDDQNCRGRPKLPRTTKTASSPV